MTLGPGAMPRTIAPIAIILLLLFLHVGHVTAAPSLLKRPRYVSGKSLNQGAVVGRATSQDPSCPNGFLCVQQACPSGVICGFDETCIDFEGTIACAPNGLTFCALNPATFEGVGCTSGTCCHGQCYVSGTVCCDAPSVQCSLGTPCNVCPPGGSCSGAGCATTTSRTSSPIAPPWSTTPVGTSSGPSNSGSATSTRTSSTTPATTSPPTTTPPTSIPTTTPSTSVSIPASIDLNGALQLFQQLSDDFNELITMVGNLTELLDEYASQEDPTSSAALQKRALFSGINWGSDIAALYPRVVEFAATPVGEEIAAAEELIPLLERGGQIAESFADDISAMSDEFQDVQDTLQRLDIPDAPPPNVRTFVNQQLVKLRGMDTATRNLLTIIGGALIGLPILIGVLAAGGNPQTATVTFPAPATVTVTTPESGTPTPYIFMMSDQTSQGQYDQVIAEVVEDGGRIIEEMTYNKLNFYAFYAEVYATGLARLDGNPLITVICNDADDESDSGFAIDEGPQDDGTVASRDVGPEGSDHDPRRPFDADDDDHHHLLNSTLIDKRALPGDLVAKMGFIGQTPVQRPRGLPYHLQWLNSLSSNTQLTGNYLDFNDYFWDNNPAKDLRSVPIYMIDDGINWSHDEFTTLKTTQRPVGVSCALSVRANGLCPPSSLGPAGRDHGTAVAAFIGGRYNGVHPNPDLRFVAVGEKGGALASVRAIKHIMAKQQQDNNPRAVLVYASGFRRSKLQPNGVTTKSDFWEELLPKLFEAQVEVVISAGNKQPDDPSLLIEDYTPNLWCDTTSACIMVGNCNARGLRNPSNLLGGLAHFYIDMYAIGTDTIAPVASQNGQPARTNGWRRASGNSMSSPQVGALLAMLIAQGALDGAGPVVATNLAAKNLLQDIGRQRKGMGWPEEDPGQIVPRAATNWQIPCPAGAPVAAAGPDPLTTYTPADGVYSTLNPSASTVASAAYVAASPVTCRPMSGVAPPDPVVSAI